MKSESKYGMRAIKQCGMLYTFRIRVEKTAFYARKNAPTLSFPPPVSCQTVPIQTSGRTGRHTGAAMVFRVYQDPIRVDCVIPSSSLLRPAA